MQILLDRVRLVSYYRDSNDCIIIMIIFSETFTFENTYYIAEEMRETDNTILIKVIRSATTAAELQTSSSTSKYDPSKLQCR